MIMKRFLICCICLLVVSMTASAQSNDMGDGGGMSDGGGMDNVDGIGGGSGDSSATMGSTSSTGYSQSEGTNSATGETYTSANSDENAVQITGGTFTMTDCTVVKSSGDTSDSDGSSFYGINSAIYCGGSNSTLNISGGTVNTSAAGANGIFAYDYGTINVSGVSVTTSSNLSRGIHATGGGIIYATDLTINTSRTNCSVIATDRGGGTVTVQGGTYTTTGDDSAITYSTGTISATGIEGSSSKGEISVIEGDNSIALTDCKLSSGSSSRGMMILQSGSGDSEGYNGYITVHGGSLTLTDGNAPLLEVPTYITGTLTLKDVTLSVPSGVLMRVNYNTQWSTYGGTGILVLTTDSCWSLSGSVEADSYSTAIVRVGEGVTWNGCMDASNAAGTTEVAVSGVWNLTADSYVDVLTVDEGATVYTNDHALYYESLSGDGSILTGVASMEAVEGGNMGTVYGLDGRKVGVDGESLDNLPAGIYIRQGKKWIVR